MSQGDCGSRCEFGAFTRNYDKNKPIPGNCPIRQTRGTMRDDLSEPQEKLFYTKEDYQMLLDANGRMVEAIYEAYEGLDQIRNDMPSSASHPFAQAGSIQGYLWESMPERAKLKEMDCDAY